MINFRIKTNTKTKIKYKWLTDLHPYSKQKLQDRWIFSLRSFSLCRNRITKEPILWWKKKLRLKPFSFSFGPSYITIPSVRITRGVFRGFFLIFFEKDTIFHDSLFGRSRFLIGLSEIWVVERQKKPSNEFISWQESFLKIKYSAQTEVKSWRPFHQVYFSCRVVALT